MKRELVFLKAEYTYDLVRRTVVVLDRIAFPSILLILFVGVFTVVGYSHTCGMGQGNIAAAKAQIKQFETALTAYTMKFNALPDSLDDLCNPPEGASILTSKLIPMDPWRNPYGYQRDGARGYVIVSLGADGVPGGTDRDADIRSDDLGGNPVRGLPVTAVQLPESCTAGKASEAIGATQ